MLNDAPLVTLDEVLAGETLAPRIYPEFSVLLVGILKLNADQEERPDAVRLYPATGREDSYYIIKRRDIDTEHVERLSSEVAAAKGWIDEKVVRIRVRPSAEIISVLARRVEAHRLSGGDEVLGSACLGTSCAPGYDCKVVAGHRSCVNRNNPVDVVACPNCV
jgi:hypothetical protein